jgi:HK97 family phage major capsid protein
LFDTSLRLGIDAQLLTGNGAGSNLNGLDSVASTFAAANVDPAADYADAVTVPADAGNANLIDLVGIAGAQIKAFGANNFWMPNYVLLNPRDFHQLFLLKDTMNNYIKNNQLFQSVFTANGVGRYFINGIECIENPGITQNTFYIGDFRKGTVYSRGAYGLELSYENRSNFEEEVVTVKVYERLNLLIRNVDANAFMKCDDIEQALFDITAPT